MTDNTPATVAGRWIVERARWDEGMRGFFVRINASGGPEDMLRHILAIEAEARAEVLDEVRNAWNTPPLPDESNEQWEWRRDDLIRAILTETKP